MSRRSAKFGSGAPRRPPGAGQLSMLQIVLVGVAAGLAAAFGGFLFAAFLVGFGLPAWWLSYLALLARPASAGPEGLQWYPIERLVLWAALLGALGIILAIPMFGTDAEGFRAGLRHALDRLLGVGTNAASDAPRMLPGISDAEWYLDVLVIATPLAAAVVLTVTSLANLWLAGRIGHGRTSARRFCRALPRPYSLPRPSACWPAISSALPPAC